MYWQTRHADGHILVVWYIHRNFRASVLFSLGTAWGWAADRPCSQECALQGWCRRLHLYFCDERNQHETSVFHERQTIVRGKYILVILIDCLLTLKMIYIRWFLQLGVHNAYLRQRILTALEEEMCQGKQQQVGDTAPSAPAPSDSDQPSAPPLALVDTYQSNECVICLENKVCIYNILYIFLPKKVVRDFLKNSSKPCTP